MVYSQHNTLRKLWPSLEAHHEDIDLTVSALHTQLGKKRIREEKGTLEDMNLVVMFGGGKDSAWALAYTRMVQLRMQELYGETFHLKSVTGRFPNMQEDVMKNMDNVFSALDMYDDPLCETMLLHGKKAEPFNVNLPVPDEVVAEHQKDILMNGHLFGGDARHTFCDQCNLKMVAAQGVGLALADADMMITGDSLNELGDYAKWIIEVAGQLGATTNDIKGATPLAKTLLVVNEIRKKRTLPVNDGRPHDSHMGEASKQKLRDGIKPYLFEIFKHTDYELGAHTDFIKDVLGFDFESREAVNFTETDCGNPLLMAHMNGLRAEKLHGSTYAKGVEEYTKYATKLMVKKQMPAFLVEQMEARYSDTESVRSDAESYAAKAYKLTPEQITAMIYAPFGMVGKNLDLFLANEYPQDNLLQSDAIHRLLQKSRRSRVATESVIEMQEIPADLNHTEEALAQRLEAITGLPLNDVATLYSQPLVYDPLEASHQVEGVAATLVESGDKDPHRDHEWLETGNPLAPRSGR